MITAPGLTLVLLFSIAYIYVLSILKREKLNAAFFTVGVAGFLVIVFYLLRQPMTYICTKILEYILGLSNKALHFYEVYLTYNIIFIEAKDSFVSLFIDYECSGVIEVMILTAIVLFFPCLSIPRKIAYILIGFTYTMIANVIRLICVASAINKYGSSVYYIAHSVIGRIVFYIFTIVLYFYMFTWRQLKTQITGRFSYNKT